MTKRYRVWLDTQDGIMISVETKAANAFDAIHGASKFLQDGDTIESVDCLDDEEDD